LYIFKLFVPVVMKLFVHEIVKVGGTGDDVGVGVDAGVDGGVDVGVDAGVDAGVAVCVGVCVGVCDGVAVCVGQVEQLSAGIA